MRRLLEIVHQQWLYRNATVHMKLEDNLTADQHRQILTRIEECLEIDPEELLDENRDLLQLDFERLATGPVKDKMKCIAEMESAMSRQSTSSMAPTTRCGQDTAPGDAPGHG